MDYEKAIGETQQYQSKGNGSYNKNNTNSIQAFWNDQIMERFIKANLFMICCVAAGLLLVSDKHNNKNLYAYIPAGKCGKCIVCLDISVSEKCMVINDIATVV